MIGRNGILRVAKLRGFGHTKADVRDSIGCTQDDIDEVWDSLDRQEDAREAERGVTRPGDRKYECWEWGEERSRAAIENEKLLASQQYMPTQEEIVAHCKRFRELVPREPVGYTPLLVEHTAPESAPEYAAQR